MLITDNSGEYTSKIVMEILGDMDIEHVPTIAYNPEEKGIAERLNLTLMNEVRVALDTAKLDWTYWTFALADAVEKYNHLPHSATGQSPHELWFGTRANLITVYIFRLDGLVPIMFTPKKKQANRGQIAKYLHRDISNQIIVEAEDQYIKRFRAVDFHPYYSYRHPAEIIMHTIQVAMETRRFGEFTRKPPDRITNTTPAPASRTQAAKYPDHKLWAKAIDDELQKIDDRDTIKWLPLEQKNQVSPSRSP